MYKLIKDEEQDEILTKRFTDICMTVPSDLVGTIIEDLVQGEIVDTEHECFRCKKHPGDNVFYAIYVDDGSSIALCTDCLAYGIISSYMQTIDGVKV